MEESKIKRILDNNFLEASLINNGKCSVEVYRELYTSDKAYIPFYPTLEEKLTDKLLLNQLLDNFLRFGIDTVIYKKESISLKRNNITLNLIGDLSIFPNLHERLMIAKRKTMLQSTTKDMKELSILTNEQPISSFKVIDEAIIFKPYSFEEGIYELDLVLARFLIEQFINKINIEDLKFCCPLNEEIYSFDNHYYLITNNSVILNLINQIIRERLLPDKNQLVFKLNYD